MQVAAKHISLSEIDDDVVIAPVFEGDSPLDGALGALNTLSGGRVASLVESGEFVGKRDQWSLLHQAGGHRAGRLLLYGCGKPGDLSSVLRQRVAGGAIRVLLNRGARSVAFAMTERLSNPESVQAVVEGAQLGAISAGLYQSADDRPPGVDRFAVVSEALSAEQLESAAQTGAVMGEATNFARALGCEPSNVLTPTELSLRAEQMAGREGLGFEVLDEDEMKQLGMGALLAVSRGSQEPARLILLTYEPTGAPEGEELIALVGKGITFDSGGISIKMADKMDEMKYDMAGGAAVVAAMQAIARLKPHVRVIGAVAASENLPSGRAVKPGDVVRSLSGKTIEVANTDAEGRLVLCDAITYCISRGATTMIDAATLTGAVVVALGDVRAGVMGNDERLLEELSIAGDQSGERVWPLPMDKEYGDLIKSDIADVRNIGNKTAGSITGGWFLRHFVGNKKWAHVDMGGTGWTEQEKPYLAKGATGFGTRLLTRFVLNRDKRNRE